MQKLCSATADTCIGFVSNDIMLYNLSLSSLDPLLTDPVNVDQFRNTESQIAGHSTRTVHSGFGW